MVRLDRIVTRAGDCGRTSLGRGGRVPKTDPRVEALGAIDELSCAIGMAAAASRPRERALLESVQLDLFVVGADVAAPGGRRALRTGEAHVRRIDAEAVRRASALPPLAGFVVPGGNGAAGWLHVARAVCRRAERRLWAAAAGGRLNPAAPRYLNRLSDLLFAMARSAAGKRSRVWEAPRRPLR